MGLLKIIKGKHLGSSTLFKNNDGIKFLIHKPHPNMILKSYQISNLIEFLKEWGTFNE